MVNNALRVRSISSSSRSTLLHPWAAPNFYGRGTGDDKYMAATFVSNLIRYKHRDLVDAQSALNEGGGVGVKPARPVSRGVTANSSRAGLGVTA